jgi:hypothetical protein
MTKRDYDDLEAVTEGFDSPEFMALLAAEDTVARVDERVGRSLLREGLSERLYLYNARAALHAQHFIVHLDDLVLFDADAYSGPVFTELTQAADLVRRWRRAAQGDAHELLHAVIPGDVEAAIRQVEADPRIEPVFDHDWDVAGRIGTWRKVLRNTSRLPPVLAAAIAWDAWAMLDPDERGPWRATLLAALVLKARGKFTSLLLPLDLGRRIGIGRWVETDPVQTRVAALCGIIRTAAHEAAKELDQLDVADGLMRRFLLRRRKTSRLPRLVDLLLAKPLVSVQLIAKTLRVSKQAAGQMIKLLGSTPRELTDRRRYRCWAVVAERRR